APSPRPRTVSRFFAFFRLSKLSRRCHADAGRDRGRDGKATYPHASGPGEAGPDRRQRFVHLVAQRDVRDPPVFSSPDEQVTALVDGAHERDAGLERLVGADPEGGGSRFGEASTVVRDGGEEVPDLELDVGEPVPGGLPYPVELLRPKRRKGLAGLIGRDLTGTRRGREPHDVGLTRRGGEEPAAPAAHEERRMRLLRRLGKPVVIRDAVVRALERERRGPPRALHDRDGFLEPLDPCPSTVVWQAERLVVDTHPPGAD